VLAGCRVELAGRVVVVSLFVLRRSLSCTTLPPGCSPYVGEGEADSTQMAVMRPRIRACFASVALPSSRRAI